MSAAVAYIAGGGSDTKLLLGAFLELLLIVSNIGTAVVIVPIMRRQFEDLSIGCAGSCVLSFLGASASRRGA